MNVASKNRQDQFYLVKGRIVVFQISLGKKSTFKNLCRGQVIHIAKIILQK